MRQFLGYIRTLLAKKYVVGHYVIAYAEQDTVYYVIFPLPYHCGVAAFTRLDAATRFWTRRKAERMLLTVPEIGSFPLREKLEVRKIPY